MGIRGGIRTAASPPATTGTGATDAEFRDQLNNVLVSNGGITVTNQGPDELALEVTAAGLSDLTEAVQDIVGALLEASNPGADYVDADGTLVIKDTLVVQVSDLETALTTGDGKQWFVVPETLNGRKLRGVLTSLTVAQSSSGGVQMQIANVTQGWDILSTRPIIDANEWNSSTGTAAVVDTASSHDVLTTGDRLRFDIDTAGTGAKGLQALLVLSI